MPRNQIYLMQMLYLNLSRIRDEFEIFIKWHISIFYPIFVPINGWDIYWLDAEYKSWDNSFAMIFKYKFYFLTFFRVTAVDGQYQIGIYSVRKIQHGEEITFDYNSVTEVCPVAYCFLSIPRE